MKPGQTVSIDGSQQMTSYARDESAETWQLPLLALSTDTKDELRRRLQRLLAPIGRTKARHMNETQIRALGPAGARAAAFVRDPRTGSSKPPVETHRDASRDGNGGRLDNSAAAATQFRQRRLHRGKGD